MWSLQTVKYSYDHSVCVLLTIQFPKHRMVYLQFKFIQDKSKYSFLQSIFDSPIIWSSFDSPILTSKYDSLLQSSSYSSILQVIFGNPDSTVQYLQFSPGPVYLSTHMVSVNTSSKKLAEYGGDFQWKIDYSLPLNVPIISSQSVSLQYLERLTDRWNNLNFKQLNNFDYNIPRACLLNRPPIPAMYLKSNLSDLWRHMLETCRRLRLCRKRSNNVARHDKTPVKSTLLLSRDMSFMLHRSDIMLWVLHN